MTIILAGSVSAIEKARASLDASLRPRSAKMTRCSGTRLQSLLHGQAFVQARLCASVATRGQGEALPRRDVPFDALHLVVLSSCMGWYRVPGLMGKWLRWPSLAMVAIESCSSSPRANSSDFAWNAQFCNMLGAETVVGRHCRTRVEYLVNHCVSCCH